MEPRPRRWISVGVMSVLRGTNFTLTTDAFADEGGAIALAESRGEHPLALDIAAVENDFHWHDFQTTTYIVSGELTVVARDTGETYTCGAGTMIRADEAGIVHREVSEGYRAVFGFDRDPKTLTMPIDKPPRD